MRVSLITAFTIVALYGAALHAQDKVAEGEYVMRGTSTEGVPFTKTSTRWILYGRQGRGYHLESEIQNQPAGLRVIQIEELDQYLVPTAIGYEFYQKDQKKPSISVTCQFSGGVIRCSGAFEKKQVSPSQPYKQDAPFWLWMEGLFALDFPWLLDGTVNMAHLREGSAKVPTVNVLGGTAVLIGDALNVAQLREVKGLSGKLTVIAPDKPTEWHLYSDDESTLGLVSTEATEVGGIKTAGRHYNFTDGNDRAIGLWTTESGLLIRMSGVGAGDIVLANYRQYKNLIPELPVEEEKKKVSP